MLQKLTTFLAILVLGVSAVFFFSHPVQSVAQCDDGIDNDGDGAVDYTGSTNRGDQGCSSLSDNDEGWRLRVSVSGKGAVTGTNINCSSSTGILGWSCKSEYDNTTNISLTATPLAGFRFREWVGACTGTVTPCTVNMSQARDVLAVFEPTGTVTLTVNQSGDFGSIYTNPPGINGCSTATCSGTFPAGSTVRIYEMISSNNADGTQMNWSNCEQLDYEPVSTGGSLIGQNESDCEIVIDANKSVSVFVGTKSLPDSSPASTFPFSIRIIGSGSGRVTGVNNFSGITVLHCGSDFTPLDRDDTSGCNESIGQWGNFGARNTVTLTASPNLANGSTFGGWGGACSGTQTTCTVTVDQAKNITATFNNSNNTPKYRIWSNKLSTIIPDNGNTGATITSSPSGISCGSDCGEFYYKDTALNITPSLANGYAYQADRYGTYNSLWYMCVGAAPLCRVYVSQPYHLQTISGPICNDKVDNDGDGLVDGNGVGSDPRDPDCVEPPGYFGNVNGTSEGNPVPNQQPTLQLNIVGSAFVTGQGIRCDNQGQTDCSESYAPGTTVVLTDNPGPYNNGRIWNGCTPSADNLSCSLVINADSTVTLTSRHNLSVQVGVSPTSGRVTSNPVGINCGVGNDCSEIYTWDTNVTLTATPEPGFIFSHWNYLDDVPCNTNPVCIVNIRSARNAFATFNVAPPLTLTTGRVSVNGGAGSVVVSSGGGNQTCGSAVCTYDVTVGSSVTLTANPATNSIFTRWVGSDAVTTSTICTGGSPCTFTMDTNKTVYAEFRRTQCSDTINNDADTFIDYGTGPTNDPGCSSLDDDDEGKQLTLSVLGTGGTVSATSPNPDPGGNPPWIENCAQGSALSVCNEHYDTNQSVTLTATLSPGYSVSWLGCTTSSGNTCNVTMNVKKDVTATITSLPLLQVIKAGTGVGTATSSPVGINCGTDCNEQYPINTLVTLNQVAGTDSTFTGWSGDVPSSCTIVPAPRSCTVTMSASKNVTVTFASTPTLRVTKAGTGLGRAVSTTPPGGINCGDGASPQDCNESYALNTDVTLTAMPLTGATWVWSGDGVPASCTVTPAPTNCVVRMTATKNITLTFTPSSTISQCSDGIDNDGDGLIDFGTDFYVYDPGCTSGTDNDEGYRLRVVVMGSATAYVSATSPTHPLPNPPRISSCKQDRRTDQCTEHYVVGQTVTLTATPSPGEMTQSWSGCQSFSGNVCTVLMNQTKIVTAVFAPISPPANSYRLTVIKDDGRDGREGTVTSLPGGINCTQSAMDCTEYYTAGTSVSLHASSESGFDPQDGSWWEHTGWIGCTSLANPSDPTSDCRVTMNSAKTVTATFRRTTLQYTLLTGHMSVFGGGGSVDIEVNGTPLANCPEIRPVCAYTIDAGSSIKLTQNQNPTSMFKRWVGSDGVTQSTDCPAGSPCTFTLSSNKTVYAEFTSAFQLFVVATQFHGFRGTPAGLITGPGDARTEIECESNVIPNLSTGDCEERYARGATVTLKRYSSGNHGFRWYVNPVRDPGIDLTPDACKTPISTNISPQYCTVVINEDMNVQGLWDDTECSDNIDNSDQDGKVDYRNVNGAGSQPESDPDCAWWDDQSEQSLVEICNNGIDDDGDGLVDDNDPDCDLGQCEDGIDNDLDGFCDVAGCTINGVFLEPDPECGNGSQNEGITAYCTVIPAETTVGQQVTWQAFIRNGCSGGRTTYDWQNHLDGANTQQVIRTYDTPGTYNARVAIFNLPTDGPYTCGGSALSPLCTNVNGDPGIEVTPPTGSALNTGVILGPAPRTGGGVVTSDTPPITCDEADCGPYNVTEGSAVILNATPNDSSVFVSWVGGPCDGNIALECQFPMPASSVTVKAQFRAAACSDGKDNDEDQKIDYGTNSTNDGGCTSSNDDNEGNSRGTCEDNIDNNGNGFKDQYDLVSCYIDGVYAPAKDEVAPPASTANCPEDGPGVCPRCNDGIDNDNDKNQNGGGIDYAGFCEGATIMRDQTSCTRAGGTWYPADPFCRDSNSNFESFRQLFQEF